MKTPKKIVIQSFKGIKPIFHKSYADVDAILNNVKRQKRIAKLEESRKEFQEAIDWHLTSSKWIPNKIISTNYKPARDNKGRFTKKFNWNNLGNALACAGIAGLLTYIIFVA